MYTETFKLGLDSPQCKVALYWMITRPPHRPVALWCVHVRVTLAHILLLQFRSDRSADWTKEGTGQTRRTGSVNTADERGRTGTAQWSKDSNSTQPSIKMNTEPVVIVSAARTPIGELERPPRNKHVHFKQFAALKLRLYSCKRYTAARCHINCSGNEWLLL